ncbi:MAG: hypothetical protein GY716_00345 [bacterium]|nr:hypothetical protein [bacterium]
MDGRLRSNLYLSSALIAIFALSPCALAGDPLLVPTAQTRSITGNAYAEDKFSGPVNDSDADSAPDFAPFGGVAGANASVDSGIGSAGGQQTSSISGNAIVAQGSTFANAETWDFGAFVDASALNRMEVTFEVTAETSFDLSGMLTAYDEGLTEVSLREGNLEIYGLLVFGPAGETPIAESGMLQPGPYTLIVRSEGNVFGSDFFPAYSSGEFDVTLTLGAGGAGGEVPDGDDIPGPPLTVEKLAGGDVRLAWSPSCRPGDTDYGVYEGDLADPDALAPLVCTTGGVTTWDLSPGFDGAFYVVVPNDGVTEGSYGDTATSTERPSSTAACVPQSLGAPVCP